MSRRSRKKKRGDDPRSRHRKSVKSELSRRNPRAPRSSTHRHSPGSPSTANWTTGPPQCRGIPSISCWARTPPVELDTGGLNGADLSTSGDLSAAFSVGYDPKAQLVYLAVIVRDDKLVIGHTSPFDTDAAEVYVDGLHSDRTVPYPATEKAFETGLAGFPVQQYIAIAGKGRIYGVRQVTNPVVIGGDVRKTRTKMAYSRKGDVTIYEWAIQVFDQYPDRPTRLEAGKKIGFDIAVVDKDVPATTEKGMTEPRSDRSAWIYWGPPWHGQKTYDAGSLGTLILGN